MNHANNMMVTVYDETNGTKIPKQMPINSTDIMIYNVPNYYNSRIKLINELKPFESEYGEFDVLMKNYNKVNKSTTFAIVKFKNRRNNQAIVKRFDRTVIFDERTQKYHTLFFKLIECKKESWRFATNSNSSSHNDINQSNQQFINNSIINSSAMHETEISKEQMSNENSDAKKTIIKPRLKITNISQFVDQMQTQNIREKRISKFDSDNVENDTKVDMNFEEIDIELTNKLNQIKIDSDETFECNYCSKQMSIKIKALHEVVCRINERILDAHEPKNGFRKKWRATVCPVCHVELSKMDADKIMVLQCTHVICVECRDGCIQVSGKTINELKIKNEPVVSIALESNSSRIIRHEMNEHVWTKTGCKESLFACPICRTLVPKSACIRMNPSQTEV
jgi:hypothetical protein